MPKPVIAYMFQVLHHRLLRFILYTCQNLWERSFQGAMLSSAMVHYCTRVQTCASVRFPNAWILWSYCVCRQHWRLASHIANLSKYRWVRRILAWNLSVRYRSLGRRPHTWDYQIQVFLSIQRSGAMSGGSEMPLSLDCTLSSFLHVLLQNQCT